jgi:NADH-quinone oxidoreductase subunit N
MPALAQYAPLLPELILAVGAMTLLMLGVFRPDTSAVSAQIMWLAILVMVAAIIAVAIGVGRIELFDGAFIVDPFARFMKILVLVGAIGAMILSFDEMAERKALKFEYPVLILLAATGMMMMVSASDLIALYLGLELQSLALYVVAAFRRDSTRSSEAGLKYFVLGALSSGMLLYGASLLYGFAGSTSFAAIAAASKAEGAGHDLLLVFGLVFVLAGVAFKISAAPFHMWTPDVYEGAPTPVTAFFTSAPKVAAMALFIRVVITMFAGVQPQWQQIVVFLAVASMLLGAFAAIRQTNIKRLMAYSSIANMGYALVGLAAGTVDGVEGVLIYIAIYVVMTLGVFACILSMRREGAAIEDIGELAGLSQTNLPMAFALAMFMFSLAGIPPLAGFFAKLYVFLPAIKAELYTLAVIGVVTSVVGAYYYLRIVKLMFFDEQKQPFEPMPIKERAVQWVALVLVLGFGLPLISAPLLAAASAAARTLF